MFDIGFAELVIIGIVALLVIGPERMPTVARTIGALMGRAQRYVNDVKSEIRREMHIEDMKKLGQHLTEQVQEVENTIHGNLRSAEEVARSALTDDATASPEVAKPEENALLAAKEMPPIDTEAEETKAAPGAKSA